MECFIRSGEFKKPFPLVRAAGSVDGISHMNDVIDFLLFHPVQKGRVDIIVPGPDMGITNDGEWRLMLGLSIERNENESKAQNE
jgi:hypothetical protein